MPGDESGAFPFFPPCTSKLVESLGLGMFRAIKTGAANS